MPNERVFVTIGKNQVICSEPCIGKKPSDKPCFVGSVRSYPSLLESFSGLINFSNFTYVCFHPEAPREETEEIPKDLKDPSPRRICRYFTDILQPSKTPKKLPDDYHVV